MPKILFAIYCFTFFSWTLYAQEKVDEAKQNKLILLPIAYYTPETSLAAGALAIINFDKVGEGRTSNIVTSASYTLKQQSIFIFQPKFYFYEGQLDTSLGLRYTFFPSEFYGRGNDVKNSDKQKFTANTFSTDAFVRYFIWKHAFVGTGGGFSRIANVDPHEGNVLQAEFDAGFREYEQKSLSASIGWDRRDYQNSPLEGAYHQLLFAQNWVEDPGGRIQNRSFTKTELDLRHYFKVGDKKVLAWQYVIGKLEGKLIPFSSLFKLGGGNQLPGYLSNKYRDKAITFTQLEYRTDISRHFTFAVFSGIGVLAPDVPTLWENRSRVAGGVGLHYIADKENRQKFRFDVGIGEESEYGVYVVFGEAF
jgi:outer membrane protein assembly factor BamA